MKRIKQNKIIVSVTNDLISDNRVHKICSTLVNMGFSVMLIGRLKPDSLALKPRFYDLKRFKLLFHKGPLFYAEYNIRLFLYLLFSCSDILLANDLDTLPANFLASKIKRIPLVYDSHEYFTEVPELITRPKVKRVWEWIEKKILPHLTIAYTVCDSIADEYYKKYNIRFKTIRNLPFSKNQAIQNKLESISSVKSIIYQGAVNMGRGLPQTIRAMKYTENANLIIAGSGDILNELKDLVNAENLNDIVKFTGQLPFEDLFDLTCKADLGISLEEDLGLNYRYALPNKLFDYIQARIPVMVSELPEMAAVVKKYNIGLFCPSHDPRQIADLLTEALTDKNQREIWKKNLEIAAAELIWEKEEDKIKDLFKQFL